VGDFFDLNLRGAANHTTATDDDADVRYAVIEGTFPDDLTGNGYYTAWDRGSADKKTGEVIMSTSFLSSPGRVLRLELGTGDSARPVRGLLRTLDNAAFHLRAIAPQTFLRDEVAEVSAFGASNLSNVAPMPFGRTGEGYRMLVGCDPAIPTEVSPSTLKVHGPVGFRHEWTPFLEGTLLPMTMTSGHPWFDPNDGPDGVLYVPELLPRPPLRPTSRIGAYPMLRTWTGSGTIKGPFKLTLDGKLVFFPEASVHQVGTTRDYVLMAMTPISFGIATLIRPFLMRALAHLPPGARQQAHAWMSALMPDSVQLPETRLLIIRKDDIRRAEREGADRVPCKQSIWPWETAHFFCDYENPDDTITLFASLTIGFDATRAVETNQELLDARRVSPSLNTVFAAATDLQVAGRYVINAATGGDPIDIKRTPSRDPDDPRFPLGVMIQIPTLPLAYKPMGAATHDIASLGRRWEHTFWCSTGWMPAMETREIFDVFRKARVTDPLNRGEPPQRYIDEDTVLDLSRRPENTATLFRLDREMNLDLERDVWRWPAGWLASSPFFAPRPKAKSISDGYLITLVTPPTSDASMQVWVFDAGQPLAHGPVCKLEPTRDAPFRIGYPLHSMWMDKEAVEQWQPPAYKAPQVEPRWPMIAADLFALGSSYMVSAVRSRVVGCLSWLRR